MKVRILINLALVAASSVVIGAEKSEPLARVGEIEISVEDVRPRIEALPENEQAALRENPTLLNQFVRSLIVQQMLLQQALANNFDKKPEVAEQLETLRDQAISQAYLRSVSLPDESFPSASEIEEVYNQNKEALRMPKQYRLAQIFVALPAGSSREAAANAKVKLDELQSSLKKSGADFAAIARTQSDDAQSAAEGGEIGWLTMEQVQPGIREKLASLQVGQVSEPVKLNDGYHIVKVLETKESYIPELAEVRDALAARLRAARAEQNSQQFVSQLVQDNPIAINELKLAELVPQKKPE